MPTYSPGQGESITENFEGLGTQTATGAAFGFYVGATSGGGTVWNFGYGYNLSANSNWGTVLSQAGISQAIINQVAGYMANPNDDTSSFATLANSALSAALTSKKISLSETSVMDAIYPQYQADVNGYLSSLGITASAVPTGVQTALADLWYNVGSNFAGPNLAAYLKIGAATGDYSSAAYELAYDTATANNGGTAYGNRCMDDALTSLGLTLTVASGSGSLTAVSGNASTSQVIEFLSEGQNQGGNGYVGPSSIGSAATAAINAWGSPQGFTVSNGIAIATSGSYTTSGVTFNDQGTITLGGTADNDTFIMGNNSVINWGSVSTASGITANTYECGSGNAVLTNTGSASLSCTGSVLGLSGSGIDGSVLSGSVNVNSSGDSLSLSNGTSANISAGQTGTVTCGNSTETVTGDPNGSDLSCSINQQGAGTITTNTNNGTLSLNDTGSSGNGTFGVDGYDDSATLGTNTALTLYSGSSSGTSYGLGDNITLANDDTLTNNTNTTNGFVPDVNVTLAANDTDTFSGNTVDAITLAHGNTVTESGDWNFFGGGSDVINGSGNTIIEQGSGTVTASNDTFDDNFGATQYAGLTDKVTGSNDIFNLSASDSLSLLTGSTNDIAGGYNDTYTLAKSDSLTLESGSLNGTAYGLGDNITLGNNDTLTNDTGVTNGFVPDANVTLAANDKDTFNGTTEDGITLSTGDTVTESGDWNFFSGGSDVLNGSGNTIVELGSGTLTGSGDTFDNNFGSTLYTGLTDVVDGSHDNFVLSASDGLTLASGSLNGTAYGLGDNITLGNNDTLTNNTGVTNGFVADANVTLSANDTDTLNGATMDAVTLSTGDTLNASNETDFFQGGADVLNGSGNTVVDSGSGYLTGSGDTFNSNYGALQYTGQTDVVFGNNDTGTLSTNDNLDAFGISDVFTENTGDTVLFGNDTNSSDSVYLANSNTDASAIFNNTDGTSQEDMFNPNGSTSDQILDYSASNDTGTLQDQTWEYDNGTSSSDLYTYDVSKGIQELDLSYDTSDAIFGTTSTLVDDYNKATLDITSADGGGSQVQWYDNTGSSLPSDITMEYSDYTGAGGTGTLLDSTSDYTNDTSVTDELDPGTGITSATGTFSGLNDTGNLDNLSIDQSNGLSVDERYTYSGGTEEDDFQTVYNDADQKVGYAEFNSSGNEVQNANTFGNYGYEGTDGFSGSYGYNFGYGSDAPSVHPGGRGTDISNIGLHGELLRDYAVSQHHATAQPSVHLQTAAASSPHASSASHVDRLIQAISFLPTRSSIGAEGDWKKAPASHEMLALVSSH